VKVLGYVRVSTQEQATSGLGRAAQEAALSAECQHRGWTLVGVVVDDGESGASLDRPGIQDALRRLLTGEADGLVVSKLDRLTRSVADLMAVLSWFEDERKTLVALDLGLDTSTPGGRLVATIFGAVASWERDVLAARTRDALAALRAQGRAISRPALVDDLELAALVRELHAEGLGPTAIARRLNELGVPTLRGAQAWRDTSVRGVLGYRRPTPRRAAAQLPSNRRRTA
jgi:DNA invertase Pin-like site-specific DNA recombinase